MLPESAARTAVAPTARSSRQSPLLRCVPKKPLARSPVHPAQEGSPLLPGDESPSASAPAIALSARSRTDPEPQSGLAAPMLRSAGRSDTPHNPTPHAKIPLAVLYLHPGSESEPVELQVHAANLAIPQTACDLNLFRWRTS